MAKVQAVINQPTGKAGLFERLVAVEKILNDKFKTTNSLVRLGSKVGQLLPSISTNLPSLDYELIGTGGVPRGRIIELFGPESSGKTSVALHVIGCEQKTSDKLCAFVDAEHALDPSYAMTLGVDVDNLVINQPDSGEQALEVVEELIKSDLFSLIVVDSVAALVPQAELDGEMGDSHMGLQARLMSQAMRKLTGICYKHNVTVIFINQIREKIGVMFGNPETTTGGRALKFYASVRIDVRRRTVIKSGDVLVGHQIELKIVKNKVGVPFKTVIIDLLYYEGFDTIGDTIQYATKQGIIEKSGAWYKYKGEQIGQGEVAAKNTIRADQKMLNSVMAEVKEFILKQLEEQRH